MFFYRNVVILCARGAFQKESIVIAKLARYVKSLSLSQGPVLMPYAKNVNSTESARFAVPGLVKVVDFKNLLKSLNVRSIPFASPARVLCKSASYVLRFVFDVKKKNQVKVLDAFLILYVRIVIFSSICLDVFIAMAFRGSHVIFVKILLIPL
jgi:hypothetical protein